jgi:hypothetical protein
MTRWTSSVPGADSGEREGTAASGRSGPEAPAFVHSPSSSTGRRTGPPDGAPTSLASQPARSRPPRRIAVGTGAQSDSVEREVRRPPRPPGGTDPVLALIRRTPGSRSWAPSPSALCFPCLSPTSASPGPRRPSRERGLTHGRLIPTPGTPHLDHIHSPKRSRLQVLRSRSHGRAPGSRRARRTCVARWGGDRIRRSITSAPALGPTPRR